MLKDGVLIKFRNIENSLSLKAKIYQMKLTKLPKKRLSLQMYLTRIRVPLNTRLELW